MFSALILACTANLTCVSVAFPEVLDSEERCLSTMPDGFKFVESNGYIVKGYLCYRWPEET